MKKARLIAGVAATIPVAAGGFAAPAAAHTTPAHQVPANGKTVRHPGQLTRRNGVGWYEVSYFETLHFRSGGSLRSYEGNVYVTCYYAGDTEYTDPYWDHFTVYTYGHPIVKSGHVADSHVDTGYPNPKSAGIPHC
jgi:hypothetical protein